MSDDVKTPKPNPPESPDSSTMNRQAEQIRTLEQRNAELSAKLEKAERELAEAIAANAHLAECNRTLVVPGLAEESLAEIERHLAEARKDTERLDWMESEKPNALCLCTWNGSTTMPSFIGGEELPPNGHIWEINDEFEGTTLRAAIDAAREKGEA